MVSRSKKDGLIEYFSIETQGRAGLRRALGAHDRDRGQEPRPSDGAFLQPPLMFAVSVHLQTLISSLPPHPIPQGDVERLVKDALEQSKSSSSTENRRAQWEFLLRNEVLNLAQSEGSFTDEPDESYFDAICDRLDVILAFTEEDAVDASFIFTILQDLLETQTITSCSHIFSWMERRAKRLTNGMVPGRGKALGLLRALNDLLSRVSKMGDMTTLCGRILTFLSAAFPLGERSGVNLRGDYGPQWETVAFKRETKPAGPDMDVDEPQKAKDENEMAVDSEPGQQTESTEEKKSSVNTEADKRESTSISMSTYTQGSFFVKIFTTRSGPCSCLSLDHHSWRHRVHLRS